MSIASGAQSINLPVLSTLTHPCFNSDPRQIVSSKFGCYDFWQFLKIKIRVFDSIARHSARDIQSGQSKVYLNFEESEEECHVCSARHSAKKHN